MKVLLYAIMAFIITTAINFTVYGIVTLDGLDLVIAMLIAGAYWMVTLVAILGISQLLDAD